MAADLGYVKFKDMLDDTNKAFEDVQFDAANQMTTRRWPAKEKQNEKHRQRC